MNDILSLFSGEKSLFRRYLVLCAALAVATYVVAQTLIALIALQAEPAQPLPLANAGSTTRTYTVTRSVLDDPATTSSIPRPAGIKVDPCRN